MTRKLLLGLLVIIGMSIVINGQGYASDVATIEKPDCRQILYFEPVEILVQFKDGAQPETFKAWLNWNDITNSFESVENGMRALVGPQDGLRVYEKGEHGSIYTKGRNLLITAIKAEEGGNDIDCRLFFSNEGGYGNTVILTILQTSDLHHHASGYGPFLDYTPLDTTDDDGIHGGYARLATLINEIRAEETDNDIPVLLCDSGDFFMGTVYDLTATDPIALKFFKLMGYDAITLGNHEFDWSPAGLYMLLNNAIGEGFDVPIVATNMVTDGMSGTADDGLEYLIGTGDIVQEKVVELANGLKVGLIGLMGEESDEQAPVAPPVTFNHDYTFIQQQVDDLRNSSGAQLVIALSHGGIRNDGTGDDADVAANLTGIDVIASGHYHTATYEAFDISDTIIFSPGEYGEYLSRLDVAYNLTEGRIVDSKFALIPVDDTIEGDPYVQGMVEQYHAAMNLSLTPLGLELTSPISRTNFSLEMQPLQETGLGNLTVDASRTIASLLALGTDEPTPYAFSVVPSGIIRDNLYPGKSEIITFTDTYNVLPLGISPDTTQPLPGYPLMSVYLTASEIRNVCEAGLTLAPMMGPDNYLNFSGVRVDYNPAGAPYLQGVTAVYLCGNTLPAAYGGDEDVFSTSCDTQLDLEDTSTLYRCVVDLYALLMMDVVTSVGLDIKPKHTDGSEIDMGNPMDYMACRIDSDNATTGVQELKEWMPLLNFLGTVFPASGDGIPESVYGTSGIAMGRVNVIP